MHAVCISVDDTALTQMMCMVQREQLRFPAKQNKASWQAAQTVGGFWGVLHSNSNDWPLCFTTCVFTMSARPMALMLWFDG
jgi:hypothetical protein